VNNTVDGGNTTRHPVAVTTSSPSANSACPAS
jgi:hypothetical protein